MLPTGIQGRTTPARLDKLVDNHRLSELDDTAGGSGTFETFEIQCEIVGELLALTLNIRHRNLTDDWYIRFLAVCSPDGDNVKHFPCNSIVFSKITLRPGEG